MRVEREREKCVCVCVERKCMCSEKECVGGKSVCVEREKERTVAMGESKNHRHHHHGRIMLAYHCVLKKSKRGVFQHLFQGGLGVVFVHQVTGAKHVGEKIPWKRRMDISGQ